MQTKTTVPCQPCHRTVCTMNDHRCMRDIPAFDVAAIAERVLNEAAPRLALERKLALPDAVITKDSHGNPDGAP